MIQLIGLVSENKSLDWDNTIHPTAATGPLSSTIVRKKGTDHSLQK